MSDYRISAVKYREPATWKTESNVREFTKKTIDEIFRVTGEVYPGQWEMQAQKHNSIVVPRPVIHFPEITIRNRSNKSIKVKDLYVTFALIPNGTMGITIPQLEGITTTFTLPQYSSGYMHSHLPGCGNLVNSSGRLPFKNFCLGSGGINDVMNNLGITWDVEQYRLFLLSIQTFLEYESLEGGPHIRMSHVFNRTDRHHEEMSYQRALTKAKALQQKLNPEVLDINMVKGLIRIKQTDKLKNFLVDNSIASDLVYVDELGKTYPIDVAMNIDIGRKNTDVSFLGQGVLVKIDGKEAPKNPKKSIHPLITSLFIKYVESLLNKQLIDKQYGIKAQSSDNNNDKDDDF